MTIQISKTTKTDTIMDDRTGQIYSAQTERLLQQLMKDVPPINRIPIGNLPVAGCEKCKGTGVKQITPSGRRIPCDCTNPAVR